MSPGQTTIIRKRKKRRSRVPIFPFVFLGLAIAGCVFGFSWVTGKYPQIWKKAVPVGYIVDENAFAQEYSQYYGKALEDPLVTDHFRAAAEAARNRNMASATAELEAILKNGAVPVIFHDLGVGYAVLGDFTRAADTFREVLARDPQYAATQKYLRENSSIPPGTANPYTLEQEPNNDNLTANLIALRTPVTGELAGTHDSADYYRIASPPSPRDLLTIELVNHSANFSARVHVYDADLRLLSWGQKLGGPGESLTLTGGPAPNSTLYIAISASDSTSGSYVLTVTPQKAFDSYEPNDDFASARRIAVGEEVTAGIMDGGDSDFFSFLSSRKGTVTIAVRNGSKTLIPALNTYAADRRHNGFAEEVRNPGVDVHYSLDVEKDTLYFVQVSSQAGTAGAYALRVDWRE
jgi:hypothetical protein